MKKIAFLIPSLRGGGAERVVLALAHALSHSGHEVHIILISQQIAYPVSGAIKLHALTKSGKIVYQKLIDRFLLASKLKKLVNKLSGSKKFDAIFVNLPQADELAHLAKLEPCYHVIHTDLTAELEGYKKSGKYPKKKARYVRIYHDKNIITVSQGIANDFFKHFNLKTKVLTTIYNPFDVSFIQQQASLGESQIPEQPYIIHAARFCPVKRFDVLLAAFKKSNLPCQLILLTKPEKELIDLIREFDLTDKVKVMGFQKNPYAWFRRAKLSVLSSEREGLPNVIIESLICGTPVVSTNCPSGPSEILTGNLSHWLVPVNDKDALAKKLVEAFHQKISVDDFDPKRFDIHFVVNQYLEIISRDG